MPDDAKGARSPKSRPPTDAWSPVYAAMLGGNQHALTHWLQGIFALSQEITQFAQARLQEDMAAWSTLAACRSPEEAVDCQRHYAAKAAEQYTEEMTKLSRMIVGVAGESFSSLYQRPTVGG